MLEKFAPMGYVTPGNWRRFVAKNGSGRVLSFTRAATTVVGTVMLCHPFGMKPGVETTSPLVSTLAEDCSVQESRRTSFSECGSLSAGLDASVARRRCDPRDMSTKKCAKRNVGKVSRFVEFINLPLPAITGNKLETRFREP